MRFKAFIVLFLTGLTWSCETKVEKKVVDYQTPYEQGSGNETATYDQVLAFYLKLAREFPEINIQSVGETDIGLPLHVVTFNPEGEFNFEKVRENKSIILINNGIHPGESDGIDATMMFFRDLAIGKQKAPEKTVIATIPVYNIGGAMNRNSTSRVNQNGPLEYGFRGNARNYDLNRDFIKADTKNAASFARIFHLLKPDVFVDTHVSNGADYQYTLTHLFTQHNKLGGNMGAFLHDTWQPSLEKALALDGWDITPYVNVFNRVPETGFSQFMDYPRYSTGYTTLWNTLGLMVETHMLKPYEDRVAGTYALLKSVVSVTGEYSGEIKKQKQEAFAALTEGAFYPTGWKIDSASVRQLNFKGYHADTIPSKVTGLPRLRYDQNRPFEKEIPYYDTFIPSDSVRIPAAYIIPAGWDHIQPYLDRNEIQYTRIDRDTTLMAEVYNIDHYQTRSRAYEGHYPHYNTTVDSSMDSVLVKEGGLWIPTGQAGVRYLLETLEPSAPDSFFNWNFFDAILQRKEGFSPYVFEDMMEELLEEDDSLRVAFQEKKTEDEAFGQNAYRQLYWLFEQSPYAEKEYKRYPVIRVPE
ncbi:M14 family metallopeptidase [Lentiprolixibacter aurantiacus]|uniref:M14 family metallopeptidase n=1 Tax=Lentiprolixibacter aurantiacus TaxID=2993939 RepID=A0AAE3MK75_9FLAO|nr:M14 family metallopeptidase [Lentiprolixibacter aurantiacus]MCX2719290.1 M14 family metallopeptidase [Lentiprolixibacter aurantiacus]